MGAKEVDLAARTARDHETTVEVWNEVHECHRTGADAVVCRTEEPEVSGRIVGMDLRGFTVATGRTRGRTHYVKWYETESVRRAAG